MSRVFQLSDIHFGSEDRQALDNAERLIHEVRPEALIVSGDLTQRGKRSEFAQAAEWLESLEIPQIVVAGNHDTPLLNLYSRARRPFERFEDRFAEKSVALETEKFSFAGLNTSRGWQFRKNWAEGSVNLNRLSAVLGDLARTNRPLRAIVCHHPFLAHTDAPLQTRTRRGVRAAAIMSRSHAQLLFTGHVHKPSVELRQSEDGRGYLSVCAGTLSRRLRDAPPSLNDIQISDGMLTIEALDMSVPTSDVLTKSEYPIEQILAL